jgi:hypothetical protein
MLVQVQEVGVVKFRRVGVVQVSIMGNMVFTAKLETTLPLWFGVQCC